MRFQVKALVCAATLSLAGWEMAHAIPITQSKAFGLVSGEATRSESARGRFGGTPIATVSPQISLSQTLSFDRFDTSLGTLTGVSFWLLSPSGLDVLIIDNIDGDGGRVTASGSVNRLLSGVPGLGDISLTSPVTLGCNAGLASPCTDNFANTPPATGAGGQSLALAGFTGVGTFDITAGLTLDAPTLAYQFAPDCGTVASSLSSSWSGTVKIEYTYTQASPPPSGVPEPASLYLTGAALLAAGAWRRRRSA